MAPARENTMRPLLALSAAIDLINEKIGYICNFLVLAACIVSAANAMIRYAFGYSSNGWLELQWYMFAILVMFGASYTFKRNEHVRVEIFYLFLTERGQLWLDLIGTLFFLIPACLLLAEHVAGRAPDHQRRAGQRPERRPQIWTYRRAAGNTLLDVGRVHLPHPTPITRLAQHAER